jgi:Holliday junction resolvase RusA-like endonuclease
MRITIPGELPGMNEIIAEAKRHFGQYSDMKAIYTGAVRHAAHGLPRVSEPVMVTLHWYTRNKKRDPDNLSAGQKFVLDGLVEAGVLPGDGWRHIAGISHTFAVDKNMPRVEVDIEEACA